jgi:hypothetical protein
VSNQPKTGLAALNKEGITVSAQDKAGKLGIRADAETGQLQTQMQHELPHNQNQELQQST